MGGVDLSDKLILLYPTKIKIKRWYHKVLFYCANMTLQSIDCSKKKQLNLLKFLTSVSSTIVNAGTIQRPSIGLH